MQKEIKLRNEIVDIVVVILSTRGQYLTIEHWNASFSNNIIKQFLYSRSDS